MAYTILGTSGYITGGERKFAKCLETKLDERCAIWHEVPVGNLGNKPDFVVLSPRHGLWVFEVKDWSPKNIVSCTKHHFVIQTEIGNKTVTSPLEQVTGYAHHIVRQLELNKHLLSSQGRLLFPWGAGVVLPNITRKIFEEKGLDQVLPSDRVICKDEMSDGLFTKDFISRLKKMLPFHLSSDLTDDVFNLARGSIYPELQLIVSRDKSDEKMPEVESNFIRIMDRHQEQLARGLGSGHRIIHGVAGSGKTMILLFRAQYLSQIAGKPTLILCFNKSLANYLQQLAINKKMGDNVVVRNFHAWCKEQLEKHNLPMLVDSNKKYHELIEETFTQAIENRKLPSEQYNAILIDEGHDFKPEWLYAAVYMLDMKYNSLLLLYDDAQSIYERSKKRGFSFRSVGIQAQGRTTILRLNYRNSEQILTFAAEFAKDLLQPEDSEDDGIPILKPESAGQQGAWPDIVKKDNLEQQAKYLADCFWAAHRVGMPWSEMAIIYRATPIDNVIASVFRNKDIPYSEKNDFNLNSNTVKFITMHSCKGLEVSLVGIPGIDLLPYKDSPPIEEARLLYVAMTRAMKSLIITFSDENDFPRQLINARKKII